MGKARVGTLKTLSMRNAKIQIPVNAILRVI